MKSMKRLHPKNTINFNHKTEDAVIKARSSKGSDGALLKDSNNNIVKINFIEKIEIPTITSDRYTWCEPKYLHINSNVFIV